MYTFSVFTLFILISLTEVRMSSAGGRIFNSFDETRRTWKDAVAYCSQLNGSYQLITGAQISYITNTDGDQSGFIWFNCHLLQNSPLNTENNKCRQGSGSAIDGIKIFAGEHLDNALENVQDNNSCLAYSRAAGNRGFTLKNCSDEGIVYCISDDVSSNGSKATAIPQNTTSSTFQESSEAATTVSSSFKTINRQSSSSLMSGLTNQTTMTTDHITSPKQTSDPPDATSIEPQATNISPTRDFLSSTLQESTEAVASEVSSTVNTSPKSTRSATTPLVSGLTSAESTEDGDDHVPSQGSTTPTVLRGTYISSTTTEKESSTVPQGSDNSRSSTTSSRVGPPNLVCTIYKRNVSQKQSTCGTGDGFPVRSVLQCASACLGATEHPCQGYDLNRNSDGGLQCVLNTGSGHAHSECDFFKDS